MDKEISELKIYMLGRFAVILRGGVEDRTISFRQNLGSKTMKLLQLLLYSTYAENKGEGYKGISRTRLLEALFGREELSNAANNLRVTVHRLKKILNEAGLPDYDYIKIEDGFYRWESPIPVWLDVAELQEKLEGAAGEKNENKQAELLLEACQVYRGELLPALSGEDWVIVNSVRYKDMYSRGLLKLCEYLKAHRDYETILELTAAAAEIYPFDEWQALQIDAMMSMNRYKEACRCYEETAKLFFEELGISPSEKMLNQFKEMCSKMEGNFQAAGEIQNGLKEPGHESGAFYCPLPSFRDSYRLLRRIIERNGQSVFLMICSLTDGMGRPMENSEKLEVYSQKLQQAIKGSLRRGDSFTKYNPAQFLILLVGTSRENCDLIFRRIADKFSAEHKSWRKRLEYDVSSVADVESDNSRIYFRGNEIQWN